MKTAFRQILLTAFITALLSAVLCFCAGAQTEGYYTYTVADGKATVTAVDSSINGDITVPETLGGYPVTAIGDSAFWSCNSLKGITIGDNVEKIGDEAFTYCKKLNSITIADSVTDIGRVAFNDTAYYKNADNWDDGLLYIGKHLVEAKDNIKDTRYIKDDTLTVADSAFSGCYDLYSIIMPESVTHIGDYAFEYCTNMQSVALGINITDIGVSAFEYCTALKAITVPDKVKNIGRRAFADCKKLEYVTIGNSVQTIGADVFSKCANITEVKFTVNDKNQSNINIMPDISDTKVKEIVLPFSISDVPENVFAQATEMITVYNPSCNFDLSCGIGEADKVVGFKNSTAEAFAGQVGAEFIDVETVHTHEYKTVQEIKATCLQEGCVLRRCICGKQEKEIITDGEHSCETVLTKATLSSDGKTESICSVCRETQSCETVAKINSATLSWTKYIYDGKNKTPKLTVKDANGKVLTKNVDYKITVASKRAGIGRYTVKVTFMGNYSGSKSLYFYILPGKPASVKSASQGTTSNKLTWSAVPGAVGYTLYYYSNSKKAYKKINTTTNTTYTVKGLLTGTKYTFKIVAYGETASGKVYDSETYALLKSATKTKTPELTKVTASSTKGKAYVYHTDVKGETGYTVYYSTSKTSGFKKYANFKADTTRCDITKLTSGKTYYFKVRTYIKTDSGYVYSPWSAVKGVKVK